VAALLVNRHEIKLFVAGLLLGFAVGSFWRLLV